MSRRYPPELVEHVMMRVLFLPLALLGVLTRPASADFATCLDASCRVYGAGGVIGSGCVFDETAGEYLILTNAHVVGSHEGRAVACEFWKDGYPSGRIAGRVVRAWHKPEVLRDIAVAAVPKSSLKAAPAIVPLAPRGTRLSSPVVLSVGCALAGWPTAWKGRVLEAGGVTVSFLPAPADGRSGSALFDEAGTMIVGLVAWRSADGAHGLGMHLGEIYAALDGKSAGQTSASTITLPDLKPVQFSPPAMNCVHGTPLAQLCPQCEPPGGRFSFRGFGNRGQPGDSDGKGLGDGPYHPWKGPGGGASGGEKCAPPPDLSSFATKSDLAAVESRLGQSIRQTQEQLNRLESQTSAALAHSQEAVAQAEVQQEKLESTRQSVFERLREFASKEELISKYQEARERGAEAGREAAKEAALKVLAERLDQPGGLGLWTALVSSLGVGGPIGIGLMAAGWLVRRRVRKRIETRLRGDGEAPREEPFRGASQ